MLQYCRRSLLAAALSLLPATLSAQQPATISGRVTSDAGVPLASANVFLEGMGLGGLTNADGRYTFTVPAARTTGQAATLTARLLGYKPQSVPVTLSPGTVTRDFQLATNPLNLGEVVITGAGTQTEAEKLGNVRNAVSAEEIQRSNEPNLVSALAAKAPNVEITSSSGEPGSSSYIRMRGQRTILGGTQPLFIVDGVPVDNSSMSTSNFNPIDELGSGEISGTAQTNRAADINPDDIESVEILKGPAAGAIYGARAGQGVVLITTKKGRAGATRYSLRSSLSFDDVSRTYPLQRKWGQGQSGLPPFPCDPGKGACFRSWGPELTPEAYKAAIQAADPACDAACADATLAQYFPNGVSTFDHSNEAYDTGHIFDNALTLSGGNDRTTFFLSASNLDNRGVFVGPNNDWKRTTVRLNATHRPFESLNISGNISYADTRGDFVGRGNNVNGLQLGLLRTPPEFNNRPYLDPETGLHRSYRLPHPTAADVATDRGFDNPFWVLNEPENSANTGRVFGNIGAEWVALNWLKVNYTLGGDYYADERLEGAPVGSSDVSSEGRVTEGKITNLQLDHNLTATANYHAASWATGTVTLGQNLNVQNQRQLSVVGRGLVGLRPYKLQNTVRQDLPIDNETNIHRESYFGQVTLDLFEQLYLTGALRNDGSSTFGSTNRRNWFPKGSAAWTFTNYLGSGIKDWITFGKLRAAYGEAGSEPGAYLTSTTLTASLFLGGISQGTGLGLTQGGFGGLATNTFLGNDNLKPERSKETELGFDLGLVKDKADVSFTWYNSQTEDVILFAPVAPSTGFFTQAKNAASIRNRGVELSLNVRPVTTATFAWELGLQWARNRNLVTRLADADFINLAPTSITPAGVAKEGQPLGVFYDLGWARCGVSPGGMSAVVEGVDLDQVCAGKPKGALYIAEDGFPVGDENLRVIGDPNPDWTGSIRTGITYRKVQVTGLLDIRQGGDIYNGTLGALRSYGTAKETENRAICTGPETSSCTGNEHTFGQGGWYDGPVVGPGAGMSVPIGQNWWRYHPASDNCAFSGFSEACIEDGSYVKLREISVGYTFDQPWVRRALGLSTVDLRLSGRNLKTWTDYKGYDPETNLGGAIQSVRGMDYFNMPQTRSFVITLGLNR